MHSEWYEFVKHHYEQGRYTTEQLAVFVKCNWITPEDYKEFTGVDYVE